MEENPGPQNNNKQKAPRCVECEKPVAKNHKRTLCTKCFDMTHAKCTRFLDPKVVSSVAPVDWTCLKCTFNALPFSLHNLDDTEIEAGEQYSSTTLNTSDICSILNLHPKHLKIMHLNTQSMISTFNEFLLTVSQYSFDVFTLSETWLKNNPYLLEYVSIPGYSAVFRNRDAIKGGGVGAYIRESLHFKRREDIEKLQPDFEHLWLEFPGRNRHSKTLVGIFYRSTRILNTRDWFDRMESLLGYINTTWSGVLVITGDMNIDMLTPTNAVTKEYQSLLEMFDLHQMIKEPTRTTRTSKTIIDHIVVNSPSSVTASGVIPCSIVSDHDGVYACVNTRVPQFKPRYKYIRNTRTFDRSAFINDFQTIPFVVAESFDDPDDQLHKLLINCLMNA